MNILKAFKEHRLEKTLTKIGLTIEEARVSNRVVDTYLKLIERSPANQTQSVFKENFMHVVKGEGLSDAQSQRVFKYLEREVSRRSGYSSALALADKGIYDDQRIVFRKTRIKGIK